MFTQTVVMVGREYWHSLLCTNFQRVIIVQQLPQFLNLRNIREEIGCPQQLRIM